MANFSPAAPTIYQSDPLGAFKRAYDISSGIANEDDAKAALAKYAQSLYGTQASQGQSLADLAAPPPGNTVPGSPAPTAPQPTNATPSGPDLMKYGLPDQQTLMGMLRDPETRQQAMALIQQARAGYADANDPMKKLQLEKLQYDVQHQGDGPRDTVAMDANTRFKLGTQQGLTGDALRTFTLTGKLPDAGGDNLINAGGGQLYDPNTKTWISAPTDTASGANLPTVSFGDNGAPDPAQQDAFLGSLDPSTAALVKGVANYQLDPTKVTTLRGDQRQKFIGLVQQYDPTFDMSQYGARAQAKKAYATGQQGQTITSANTVIGHLSNLADDAAKLGNGDFVPFNMAGNAIKGALSDKDLAKFNSDKMAVASELAKFFKGTGATDLTTTQEWQSIFDQNTGPGALKAVVANVVGNLMKSRLDEMRSQYTAAMGKPADFRFITPETDAVLQKMGIDTSSIDPMFGSGGSSAASSGAPAVGAIMDGYRFKGGDPSDQNNWEQVQ